jgi:hypothetical protein
MKAKSKFRVRGYASRRQNGLGSPRTKATQRLNYLGQRSGRSAGLCAGVHVVRIEAREIVSGRMTDAQLAEAQTLAREWMPTAQPRFPSDESSK